MQYKRDTPMLSGRLDDLAGLASVYQVGELVELRNPDVASPHMMCCACQESRITRRDCDQSM